MSLLDFAKEELSLLDDDSIMQQEANKDILELVLERNRKWLLPK